MHWNSVSSTDSASSARLGVSGEHMPLQIPRCKSACKRWRSAAQAQLHHALTVQFCNVQSVRDIAAGWVWALQSIYGDRQWNISKPDYSRQCIGFVHLRSTWPGGSIPCTIFIFLFFGLALHNQQQDNVCLSLCMQHGDRVARQIQPVIRYVSSSLVTEANCCCCPAGYHVQRQC